MLRARAHDVSEKPQAILTRGSRARRAAVDDGGPDHRGVWRAESDAADAISYSTARDENNVAARSIEESGLRDVAIRGASDAGTVTSHSKAGAAAQAGRTLHHLRCVAIWVVVVAEVESSAQSQRALERCSSQGQSSDAENAEGRVHHGAIR